MKRFALRSAFVLVVGVGAGVCIAMASACSQQKPTTTIIIHQRIIQRPPDDMQIPSKFYVQPHDFQA